MSIRSVFPVEVRQCFPCRLRRIFLPERHCHCGKRHSESGGTCVCAFTAGRSVLVALCCASVLAVWYPATHAARKLLDVEAFAQTWYVFWILPLLFISLNISIIPINPNLLKLGRLRQIYILLSLVFLPLLLLLYALFYLMASSLNRNDRLRRENQLLSMQQARYDSLRVTIGQIRQARHDMRHHFHILQGFAAQENWERLASYLDEVPGQHPGEQAGTV